MPVSSPPYKDVSVAGQVQVLSPRTLTLSVPQTSSCSVYCPPELITTHANASSTDEHREPIQLDNSMQCRRPVSTSPASVRSDGSLHFFNTHSPPLLNLSPNLSPSMSDVQVTPPCYDLRESTRRQSSLYGKERLPRAFSFCLKFALLEVLKFVRRSDVVLSEKKPRKTLWMFCRCMW